MGYDTHTPVAAATVAGEKRIRTLSLNLRIVANLEAINAAAKLIEQIMRAYIHHAATGFHHNYMVRWQSRRAPAESTLLVVSLTDATDADLALQNASTLNERRQIEWRKTHVHR